MITTDTTFTLLDIDTNPLGTLLLSGGVEPALVQLEALTDTPSGGSPPVVLTTINVPALNTVSYNIQPASFPAGYGAIRARSVDNNGNQANASFIAYLSADGLPAMFPVSGSAFRGTTYRIPHLAPAAGTTQKIKIAVTNLGPFQRVHIRSPHPLGFKKYVDLNSLQSYQWDSSVAGVNVNKAGIVEVHGSIADVAVSATILSGTTLTRTYPARF